MQFIERLPFARLASLSGRVHAFMFGFAMLGLAPSGYGVDVQMGDDDLGVNQAEALPEGQYQVYPSHLFVPEGFTDNDNVQLVLDGWKNAACDSVLAPKVTLYAESKTIGLEAVAQQTDGSCAPNRSRFTSVADLGVLPIGKYRVVTNDGWLVVPFEVVEAPAGGPTEADLAVVETITVEQRGVTHGHRPVRAGDTPLSGWVLVLSGTFHATCEALDAVQVINSGRSIEVTPTISRNDQQFCSPSVEPFVTRTKLPDFTESGRYLIHVKTHGATFNQVISVGAADAG